MIVGKEPLVQVVSKLYSAGPLLCVTLYMYSPALLLIHDFILIAWILLAYQLHMCMYHSLKLYVLASLLQRTLYHKHISLFGVCVCMQHMQYLLCHLLHWLIWPLLVLNLVKAIHHYKEDCTNGSFHGYTIEFKLLPHIASVSASFQHLNCRASSS
jgi:hypothetical protein